MHISCTMREREREIGGFEDLVSNPASTILRIAIEATLVSTTIASICKMEALMLNHLGEY